MENKNNSDIDEEGFKEAIIASGNVKVCVWSSSESIGSEKTPQCFKASRATLAFKRKEDAVNEH